MAKLGQRNHRWTVAIFSWLHLILSVVVFINSFFQQYRGRNGPEYILFPIGLLGLYGLEQENHIVMKIIGGFLIVLLVLPMAGFVIILYYVIENRSVDGFEYSLAGLTNANIVYICTIVAVFALSGAYRRGPIHSTYSPTEHS